MTIGYETTRTNSNSRASFNGATLTLVVGNTYTGNKSNGWFHVAPRPAQCLDPEAESYGARIVRVDATTPNTGNLSFQYDKYRTVEVLDAYDATDDFMDFARTMALDAASEWSMPTSVSDELTTPSGVPATRIAAATAADSAFCASLMAIRGWRDDEIGSSDWLAACAAKSAWAALQDPASISPDRLATVAMMAACHALSGRGHLYGASAKTYTIDGTGPYAFPPNFTAAQIVAVAGATTLTPTTDYTVSGRAVTLSSGAASTYDAQTLSLSVPMATELSDAWDTFDALIYAAKPTWDPS